MERLCGWLEKGYRFEIKVPSTVYENDGHPHAEITAYRGKTYVADKIYCKLKTFPRWDIPLQAVMLSQRDDARLKRSIKTLIDRLPEKEDVLGNYCNSFGFRNFKKKR